MEVIFFNTSSVISDLRFSSMKLIEQDCSLAYFNQGLVTAGKSFLSKSISDFLDGLIMYGIWLRISLADDNTAV